MEPITFGRIAGDVATAAVKKIPDLIFSILGAAWRAYWRLGIVGMFLATACVGAGLIVVIGSLPLPAATRSSLQGDVGGLTVLMALVALFVGMFRGGRR